MATPRRPRDPGTRIEIGIRGAVQGVGFRPFVYRLANELALSGWVVNDSCGVTIQVEGERQALDEFLRRLPLERLAASLIWELERAEVEPTGGSEFTIRDSEGGGPKVAEILPDLATCPACLAMEDACGIRVEGALRELQRLFYCGEAIETARALGRLPATLIVYGIEGADFGLGVGLTREVERAASRVAARLSAGIRERALN